jgi:Arc/MetJ-type ribon-helix-helix transcriptional regulator
MTTMQVELPEALYQFVCERAAAEGYASPADYVLALIRRATRRAEFEAKILEGLEELDRGEGQPVTRADWDELRAEIRARYGDGE